MKPLLTLYIVIQCFLCAAPFNTLAADATIRIGLLCDISGPGAKTGMAEAAGVRAAIDAVNSEDWAKTRPLELIISDTAGDPARLSSQAEAIVKSQGVIAIINCGITSPLISGHDVSGGLGQALNVPVINTQSGNISQYAATEPVTDWNFSVAPDLNTEIKALYQWVAGMTGGPISPSGQTIEPLLGVDKARIARIGPITPVIPDSERGKKIMVLMRAYSTESGIKTTSVIKLDAKDPDLGLVQQVKKARGEGASVAAAFGVDQKSYAALANAADEAGINLAMPAAMLSDDIFKDSPKNVHLLIIAPPVLVQGIQDSDPCKLATIQFRLALGNDIGSMPPQEIIAAGAGWDAVHILATGIKKLQDPTRESLRDAIENMDAPYEGVMGAIRPSRTAHTGPSPESLIIAIQKENALVSMGTDDGLDLRLSTH